MYNQTKLGPDGLQINGAVPDSLKPEGGGYASSMLTDSSLLAYNAMQLTGWAQYPEYGKPEGKIHVRSKYKIEQTQDRGQESANQDQ